MARQIDPTRKAAAIADLMNGDQPAIVAARYEVPSDTVRKWKQRLVTPDVTDSVTSGVTKAASVVRQPQHEAQQIAIGELIMQNLRAKLIATQKIAEHAANTEWIKGQNAADVAQLFEVIDRSAVSILDRMAHRRSDDDTGSE